MGAQPQENMFPDIQIDQAYVLYDKSKKMLKFSNSKFPKSFATKWLKMNETSFRSCVVMKINSPLWQDELEMVGY